MTNAERETLRRYHTALGEAKTAREVSERGRSFRRSRGITMEDPLFGSYWRIGQAHLARVKGLGSPAAANAVFSEVTK